MASTAPAKSRNITEANPNVVYRKMPKAGAPMEAMDASIWSRVLMRSRCLSGTSMGMAAIMAGLWKACPTARATQMASSSGMDTSPSRMSRPATRDTTPTAPSAAIMMVLRLCRSATTPPKGDSSPMGSMAATLMNASTSALPVLSVTYHTTA